MRMLWTFTLCSLVFSGVSFGETLDLSVIPRVTPAPNFIEAFLLRYLPKVLAPTDNKDEAQRQIEKNVTHNLGEDLVASSKFASKVKKVTSAQLNIVSSTRASVQAPLRFAIDATRAQASFFYVGAFNSALSFVGKDKNIQFSLSKEMTQNTFLSFKEETPISGLDLSSRFEFAYTF